MNQKIPQKASCKYLGLHIDGKMTFKDHIYYVVKKLSQFSGLVHKVRHLNPSKCLLLFHNSYTDSVIRYGLLLYGSAAKTNLKKFKRHSEESGDQFFPKKNWEIFSEKLIVSRKQLKNTNFSLFSNCMY